MASFGLENRPILPTLPAYQRTNYDNNTSRATLQETNNPEAPDDHDEEVIIPLKYLDFEFDAVFLEHKSTRTIPAIYDTFGKLFKYLKLFFYHVLVLIFSLPLIVLWAFFSSFFLFLFTWVLNPILKLWLLIIGAALPFITEPLKAMHLPWVDAAARIFSKIHVKASLSGNLLSPLTNNIKTV